MRKLIIIFIGLMLSLGSQAQGQKDPTLFTVGQYSVPLSEFSYVYAKTNQEKADFSEKSLRDYLDLYIKFKLKVANARELQVDTVTATKNELESYRRSLSKSYLEDKEVTDKLVKETYQSMLQDVAISHIFITCDKNAKAADTLRAYNRARNLFSQIEKGASFEQIAADSSDDKTAKENRGDLGYITAMLPEGYYQLERTSYAGQPGKVYGPIRSNNGYHIIRVNGFRPARGEVEVSQIMLRKSDNADKNAKVKMRADSIYNELKKGAKWDDVCQRFSDDKNTSGKGGYLGFFAINRYQRNFEDAAFALEKDGDFSMPVESNLGWHIIKRNSRRPIDTFDKLKRPLTDRVRRDSRSEVAKQSMIARIKKEGQFSESRQALQNWVNKQDSTFFTFKWKPDEAKPKTELMRFGSSKIFTVADFEEYCARASRDRMRGTGSPIGELVDKLYKSWSDDVSMQFEETQLDTKYPEFKSLMREYTEGIIMFEALKINVFDRANTDSIGLQKYFDANLSQKYKWDERAKLSLYTLKSDDPKLLEKLRELAAKKPAAEVLKKMNKKGEVVSVMERLTEKGKVKELGDKWAAGLMTDAKTDAGTKTATFYKIEAIVPPTPKALNEARGYAVADYQDYLEKQWIEDLRLKYPVKINEDVLKSMVKK